MWKELLKVKRPMKLNKIKFQSVMFYEMRGMEIIKTESVDLKSLMSWMEVVKLERFKDYSGMVKGDVMEFLESCDWEKNGNGDWCSEQFLCRVGVKLDGSRTKLMSTGWVTLMTK
jgi:hypothetical protein